LFCHEAHEVHEDWPLEKQSGFFVFFVFFVVKTPFAGFDGCVVAYDL